MTGKKLKQHLDINKNEDFLCVGLKDDTRKLYIPIKLVSSNDMSSSDFVETMIDDVINTCFPDKDILEVCKVIPDGKEQVWYNGQGYSKLFYMDEIFNLIKIVEDIKNNLF